MVTVRTDAEECSPEKSCVGILFDESCVAPSFPSHRGRRVHTLRHSDFRLVGCLLSWLI